MAREAIHQAALDRVRGEIASMRNPDDLKHISQILFSELTNLGVPFIRCGVFIVDEPENECTCVFIHAGRAIVRRF